MIIMLLFANTAIISMDLIETTKEPSYATKLALEAIQKDSVVFLKAALAINADIDHISEGECNFLLLATKTEKKETALYLSTHEHFQQSAIINHQSRLGHTSIMCASCHGYKEVVENLLKIKNINLDLQDSLGNSALYYACHQNHNDIIALLLEHGANPTVQNNHGATVAFLSSTLDNTQLNQSIVKKLIQARNMDGDTQLHLFTRADIKKMAKSSKKTIDALFVDIFDHLIKLGTSIWDVNNRHMLPVETAYERYNQLYQQCITTKMSYLQNRLNSQEKLLHLLLLYYVKVASGNPIAIASSFARELNIETVLAEKYKNKEYYYADYTIEFKDKLKKQPDLSNIPVRWITTPPVHSYIPPQLVDDALLPTNQMQYYKTKNS